MAIAGSSSDCIENADRCVVDIQVRADGSATAGDFNPYRGCSAQIRHVLKSVNAGASFLECAQSAFVTDSSGRAHLTLRKDARAKLGSELAVFDDGGGVIVRSMVGYEGPVPARATRCSSLSVLTH